MSSAAVLEAAFAPLATVNFLNLYVEGKANALTSSTEGAKLFHAANSLGFFYLDLRDCPSFQEQNHNNNSCTILEDVSKLFKVMKQLFDLPIIEKETYNVCSNKRYLGYKGLGKSFIDKDGTLDCNEFYNISRDDIIGHNITPLPQPSLIHDNKLLFHSFAQHCRLIVTTIFAHFSAQLCLDDLKPSDLGQNTPTSPGPSNPITDPLSSLHRPNYPSGDLISLIKYPLKPNTPITTPLAPHTDYGSLTILFAPTRGLQVLVPLPDGSCEWRFIDPLPGHAIVNCGDALSLLTNGAARSNIHRVAGKVDRAAAKDRYSLGYFCRPEDEVVLRPLKGGRVPETASGQQVERKSKEWVLKRQYGRLVGEYRDRTSWNATLGTDEALGD